jgi:hypothetical protein
MARLPEQLRRTVITTIYRRADELDWDGLTPADRSMWYMRWLDDPDIGGALEPFLTRDQSRLWIKENPMKHYTRARSGIGPYAAFATPSLPGPEKITRLAFGPDWTPVAGSLREKPKGCAVTDNNENATMFWGPPRSFPALIWAGLNAVVDAAPTPVVVVLTRQGEPQTDGEVSRQQRIAALVGVGIRHVSSAVTQAPATGGSA